MRARLVERRSAHAAVVAGPVEPLVVGAGEKTDRGESPRLGERALGEVRMQPHAFPLAEAERPGLLPDRVRDADPAEVGRERGAPQERDGLRRQAQAPGGGLGEVGDGGRMLAEPGRLEAGERGEGGEAGVDPVSGEADLGKRLALERVLPHPRVVQLGAHVVEVPHGELGQARIVRGARSALEDGARVVGAGGGEEERVVPRHVEETRRQRQRLTADAARRPLAVPAREDVLERRLDSRAELEPAREPLRHLAHRRERLARPRPGSRAPPRSSARAPRSGRPGPTWVR